MLINDVKPSGKPHTHIYQSEYRQIIIIDRWMGAQGHAHTKHIRFSLACHIHTSDIYNLNIN